MKHWAENAVMAKKINLGLDLQGGMNLVMQADFNKIESKSVDKKKLTDKEKNELTQQALELIRNRIDKFGVCRAVNPSAGERRDRDSAPRRQGPEGGKKGHRHHRPGGIPPG